MNSDDVYSISGRIKNMMAREDLAISPVGTILVNGYTLVLRELHEFAETLPEESKKRLTDLLYSKENFVVNVIKLATPKPEKLSFDPNEECDIFDRWNEE